MAKIHLLIIDAQWDFCHAGTRFYDASAPNPDPFQDFIHRPGALYVEGAYGDCVRLGNLIKEAKNEISQIFATMDSHNPIHIAHCDFWRDANGNMPTPFTIITLEDIVSGKWRAANPAFQSWVELEYFPGLEMRGRNPLCTWPKHCIQGTLGWAMHPEVSNAVTQWCETQEKEVNWKFKGQSTITEMYSAVEADVPDPDDLNTSFDSDFTQYTCDADLLVLAGEASSHCLLWTYKDMDRFIGERTLAKRTVFLTDAMSPVPMPPCIEAANNFLAEYTALGAKQMTCKEFIDWV